MFRTIMIGVLEQLNLFSLWLELWSEMTQKDPKIRFSWEPWETSTSQRLSQMTTQFSLVSSRICFHPWMFHEKEIWNSRSQWNMQPVIWNFSQKRALSWKWFNLKSFFLSDTLFSSVRLVSRRYMPERVEWILLCWDMGFCKIWSIFSVGMAGTGKSQVWKTLFRTYQNQKKKPHICDLNPKVFEL